MYYVTLTAKSKIEVQKLSLSALVISRLKNCEFINHNFFLPCEQTLVSCLHFFSQCEKTAEMMGTVPS